MTQYQQHQNEENKRQLADLMIAQNFAILDIEYIQARKNHKCIRKIHILAKNGSTKLTKEFYPYWKFNVLNPNTVDRSCTVEKIFIDSHIILRKECNH